MRKTRMIEGHLCTCLPVPLLEDLASTKPEKVATVLLKTRMQDSAIEATAMFEAAFPGVGLTKVASEKSYVVSRLNANADDDGGLWLLPTDALKLADDYGLRAWISALLAPPQRHPITRAPRTASFILLDMAKSTAGSPEFAAPSTSKASRKHRPASREIRSASPVKMAQPTPTRPKASPKKRSKKANGIKHTDEAIAAGKALKDAMDFDASPSVADSEDEAAAVLETIAANGATDADMADTIAVVNGAAEPDEELKENTARVTVTSDVVDEGDAETTRTSVKVELPAGSPDQPLPENPEEAIAQAKELVQAAKFISQNETAAKSSRKRKAEALEVENTEEEVVEEIVDNGAAIVNGAAPTNGEVAFGERTDEPPTKRTRVMVPAEDFRRKKMQTRALMGLSATVAVGAIIPFISNLF